MNIFGLGHCHHATTPEDTHVRSKDIRTMAKQLKSFQSCSKSNSGFVFIGNIEILAPQLAEKLKKARNTVQENQKSHNSSKLEKLDSLVNDAQDFSRSIFLRYKTPQLRTQTLETKKQIAYEKSHGIDMGGMVK